MLSQNQKILENQLQSLGISVEAMTQCAPIQAYRVHFISQIENIKMLTDYENWGKEDIPQKSRREDFVKVGKGLKAFLSATFESEITSFIHKEAYGNALKDVQLLFTQKIEQIIGKFTPEEARYYQRVVSFYEANKQSTYFLDKNKAPVQTAKTLLQLDLFSFLLQQNEQIYLSSQNYKLKDIFSKPLAMRIHGFGENQYDNFRLMFNEMRQFIGFDGVNQFRDIMAILCFVEVKRKISAYYSTNPKQKRQVKETCEVIVLANARPNETKTIVKFKFCEFGLMSAYFWTKIKNDMIIQSKLITGILSISKDDDKRSRNEVLLTLKIKLNCNLRQICHIYESLQDHQAIQSLKNQLQWKVNIDQWKNIRQNRSVTQTIGILEDSKLRNSELISNYFVNKIQTRYAIKRFALTATIAESIKKIMRFFPGHQEVFVHYFTYKFKRKEDKAPKVFVSLILATKGDDIFFEALFPFKLSDYQFVEYLLNFFDRLYEKTKISYEINIYSFSYKYLFLEQPCFKLINSMKKISNSFVFPLNSKLYFKKHFTINKAVQMRLYLHSSIINEDNFYDVVKKILLEIGRPEFNYEAHNQL